MRMSMKERTDDWPDKCQRVNHRKNWKLWANMWALQLVLLSSMCAHAMEVSVLDNLQKLGTSLPGCYGKVAQYQKQPSLPSHKLQFLKRSEIFKMAKPIFNDSLTFYFQDFTKSTSKPTRAGFYSFSADFQMDAVRMKTLHLKRSMFTPEALRDTQNSSDLTEGRSWAVGDFRTFSECDMVWRRMANGALAGVTGPSCLRSLGADQVRIGVSMTLSGDRLLVTEGWYSLNDVSRLSEFTISYVLHKHLVAEDSLHGHHKFLGAAVGKAGKTKFGSVRPRQTSGSDTLSEFLDKSHDLQPGIRKSQKKIWRKGQQKILRNFKQVVSALTSGSNVYYWIDLSLCSTPDQVMVEKFFFGGRIKNFVYVKHGGSKTGAGSYINFQSQKKVRASSGPETVVRYVSLHRDGRVKVRVLKVLSEPAWIKQEYSFDCRLYKDHSGYVGAGVRLTLDPPGVMRSFNNVRTFPSIDHDRDLQTTADLAWGSR